MYAEPKIIIIADDDHDDSLFLLTSLLSLPLDLTILSVSNGETLIRMLETVSPEVIFLDINMPRKNGFDALKHIRSTERSHQPTVIMCSTSNSPHDLRKSQELGADMYITKPTSLGTLNKMVSDILERKWSGIANERVPGKFLLSHVQ